MSVILFVYIRLVLQTKLMLEVFFMKFQKKKDNINYKQILKMEKLLSASAKVCDYCSKGRMPTGAVNQCKFIQF